MEDQSKMQAHRATDDETIVKIDRRVPLTWLISTISAVALAAVSFYVGLMLQADQLRLLTVAVNTLTIQINQNNVGNATRDALIAQNTKDISELKGAFTAHLVNRPGK